MTWTFVGQGTFHRPTSGDVVTGEATGTAEGDLIVAVIGYRGNAGFTVPAGWTVVEESNTGDIDATNGIGSAIMAYIVRGASAPSFTFTRTGGDVAEGRCFTWRQSDPGAISLDTSSVALDPSTTTTATTAGITTATDNELLIAMVGAGDASAFGTYAAATDPTTASGTTSTTTSTVDSTWRLRHTTNTSTGADVGMSCADALKGTAGATGAFTATGTVVARNVMIAAAFKYGAAAIEGTLASTTDATTLAAVGELPIEGTLAATTADTTLAADSNIRTVQYATMPNLLTNGTFDTDLSTWTVNSRWTWASGTADAPEPAGFADMYQSPSVTPGTPYRVIWDNATFSAGASFGRFQGGGNVQTRLGVGTGTFEDIITPPTGTTEFHVWGSSLSVLAVDNVVLMLALEGFDGSLAATLDDAILAAEGSLASPVEATLAVTLDSATLAAEGELPITAEVAVTLDASALAAEGELPIVGELAATLDDATLDSDGSVLTRATLAVTLDDVTLESEGENVHIATLDVTLDDATLEAEGGLAIAATLAITLDDVTLEGEADLPTAGTLAVTLESAWVEASGELAIAGTLAITIDDVVLSSEGEQAPPNGQLAITLDDTVLYAEMWGSEYVPVPAARTTTPPTYVFSTAEDWDGTGFASIDMTEHAISSEHHVSFVLSDPDATGVLRLRMVPTQMDVAVALGDEAEEIDIALVDGYASFIVGGFYSALEAKFITALSAGTVTLTVASDVSEEDRAYPKTSIITTDWDGTGVASQAMQDHAPYTMHHITIACETVPSAGSILVRGRPAGSDGGHVTLCGPYYITGTGTINIIVSGFYDEFSLTAVDTITDATAIEARVASVFGVPLFGEGFPLVEVLREDLAKVTGATMIGLASGLTLQDYMDADASDVVAPTLTNSWVDFGGAHQTAGYWKDGAGIVHLVGVIKSGTVTSAAFTLPVGFRPAAQETFAVPNSGAYGEVYVTAAGAVVPSVGSNTSCSLSGITFRAA